jgi:hypothetical protein
MKRKLVNIAIFLPLLACLMGAGTIDWAAGQPNPNPGGAKETVEGKGSFAIGLGDTLLGIELWALKGQFFDSGTATVNAPNWDKTLKLSSGAGDYDCHAQIVTEDSGGKLWSNKTTTKTVTVK